MYWFNINETAIRFDGCCATVGGLTSLKGRLSATLVERERSQRSQLTAYALLLTS
jgi:hypothetical protein